jgi:hypothetical protein
MVEDMAQQIGTDAYMHENEGAGHVCGDCDNAQAFMAADGSTALAALGKPWKASLVAQKMASTLVENCAYCLCNCFIVRKDESADACEDWERA